MTVPFQYANASREFDSFLEDLRVRLDHVTTHQTYQTLEGVLRVFRRRLTVTEGLAFADSLPAVLRAIFVAEWQPGVPVVPFGRRESLNDEVQAYRRHHNLTPPDAIDAVSEVLWRHLDPVQFARTLATLPREAAEFWRRD